MKNAAKKMTGGHDEGKDEKIRTGNCVRGTLCEKGLYALKHFTAVQKNPLKLKSQHQTFIINLLHVYCFLCISVFTLLAICLDVLIITVLKQQQICPNLLGIKTILILISIKYFYH